MNIIYDLIKFRHQHDNIITIMNIKCHKRAFRQVFCQSAQCVPVVKTRLSLVLLPIHGLP